MINNLQQQVNLIFYYFQLLTNIYFQVAALQQQVASGSAPMEGVEVAKIVSKNNNLTSWNTKITESNKFKIGKENAFSSLQSCNAYVRLLIKGFNTLPTFAAVSFEELFEPVNGYANFRTLLNTVPVPIDHDGFYINDKRSSTSSPPSSRLLRSDCLRALEIINLLSLVEFVTCVLVSSYLMLMC